MDTCGSSDKDVTETSYVDEKLNELDQEDPVLVEAIKKMMIKPTEVRKKVAF